MRGHVAVGGGGGGRRLPPHGRLREHARGGRGARRGVVLRRVAAVLRNRGPGAVPLLRVGRGRRGRRRDGVEAGVVQEGRLPGGRQARVVATAADQI